MGGRFWWRKATALFAAKACAAALPEGSMCWTPPLAKQTQQSPPTLVQPYTDANIGTDTYN